MGRKKIHVYWTEDVDVGIQKYLASDNQYEKNMIYEKYLRHPFQTFCEIMVRRYKWNYIPLKEKDLVHELTCLIITKLHYYKPHKGKSFGYFGWVVKNYLVQQNNKGYRNTKRDENLKRLNQYGWLDGFGSIGHKRNWTTVNDVIERKETYDSYIDFLEKNHKEILPDVFQKFVEPTIHYYKDVENTKHDPPKGFSKYIDPLMTMYKSKNLSLIHRRSFQKLIKHLFQTYKTKMDSVGELKNWVSDIQDMITKRFKNNNRNKLLEVHHYESIK